MNNCGHAAATSHGDAATRPLHVAHGVLSMELGGLERLVLSMIETGRRRGYRSSVVCVDETGRLAEQARALGAEVHSLDTGGERTQATQRAAELFAQLRPDVLHTHQTGALWHLGRAAQRAGIATVHTEHSDHARLARGLHNEIRMRLWWRRASRLARRFCCVSEDIARSVRRWRTVDGARVAVVPNGVDTALYAHRTRREALRRALGLPADAQVIGTVGRLTEVKRQDLLLRAFARIAAERPRAWLLLVGDGEQRAALETLAQACGLHGRIVFAGYQTDIPPHLAAMDVFAMSSRHEGLPLALLEAWAARLPVVSSAVGGVPHVVRHGYNGLLFDNGDEAALATALARLLDDTLLAQRLAAAGEDSVCASFSLERMAERYDGHYRAALACPLPATADVSLT
ncbi:MAG: glycosyltransferase [Pseudoxanthomonas sp.]